MTTIGDGCGCDTGCDWKEKLNEAYNRAVASINKVKDNGGQVYYPDGTGAVTLPLLSLSEYADLIDLIPKVTALETDDAQAKKDIKTLQDASKHYATDIAQAKSDISQLKISDAEHTDAITTLESNVDAHARQISAINVKDATQDCEISKNANDIAETSKALVSDVVLSRTGPGKIQASIEREDALPIDSDVLDMVIPVTYQLITGSTARAFKMKVVMSDGTSTTTNDFLIPEGGGTDVTVSTITMSKPTDNTIKVVIGLSDGTTLETDPATIASNVVLSLDGSNRLVTTVNGQASNALVLPAGKEYTAGSGIAISEANAISIDQSTREAIGDSFSSVALGSDGKSLDFTANDGQTNSVSIKGTEGDINNSIRKYLFYNKYTGEIQFTNSLFIEGCVNYSNKIYPFSIRVGKMRAKPIVDTAMATLDLVTTLNPTHTFEFSISFDGTDIGDPVVIGRIYSNGVGKAISMSYIVSTTDLNQITNQTGVYYLNVIN